MVLAWMLLLGAAAPAARAQDAAPPAEPIRRLVARMGFEDPTGSGEPIPRHWVRTELPGGRFPLYVEGALSEDHAYRGASSFRLALDGGNVAYTYTGPITVHPSNDYLLVGYVRTEGLQLARAQARLIFIDARGRPIDEAVAISEPFGGPGAPSDGQWRRFEVRLRGQYPDATRLRIMLGLLQPPIWQGDQARDVYQQDIDGYAWFDELSIYRLPRVQLSAPAPANIFAPGETPRLELLIDGVDHADCSAVLTVYDASGGVRTRRVIDINPNQWTLQQTIDLGAMEPGLYLAELMIAAGGEALTHQRTRFAVLAELPATGRSGLGVDATAEPARRWPELLRLCETLGASELKLPAWPLDGVDDPDDRSDWPLARMLDRCRSRGIRPTIVAPNLPPNMRTPGVASAPLVDVLAGADPTLRQTLSSLAVELTNQVDAWQIGDVHDYDTIWHENLPAAHANAQRWLSDLLVHADVPVAWNLLFSPRRDAAGRLAAVAPAEIMPEEIPSQLEAFGGRVHNLHLAAQPAETHRLAALADLALRYGYARAGGADEVFIDPPWTVNNRGQIEPTERLLVARTLATELGDARYVGAARLGPTALAMIFDAGASEGRMLIYSRPGEGAPEAPVELDLPAGAYVIDLWGRRSELARNDAGRAVLTPGPIPQLVVGCELEPLALRASMRVTPEVLPSVYEKHTSEIRFANPFDQPVTGTITLHPPEGWVIRPLMARFHLAPGEHWAGQVEIQFPYNETLGLKRLDAVIEIDARRQWTIDAPGYFFLAMEGVVFDTIQTLGPQGSLEIQQLVTNHTDQPLSFNCWVQAPGRPRQSRLIQELPPGQTAVKLFRFENGNALRGMQYRAGLRQVEGPAVLNRTDVIR